MGDMPDVFYPEQLPYLVKLIATFTLLCLTKAMNLELFFGKD